MQHVRVPMLHCYRCAYSWRPRSTPVRRCPVCKSIRWDVPRVKPYSGPRNGLGIHEVVQNRRALKLLLERAGAKNVRVFGSVARGTAGPQSDLDLLIGRFDPPIGLLGQLKLITRVERSVGREVDLVLEDELFWLAKPQILSEAVDL